MKMSRRLDFEEENGAVKIERLNDIANREVNGAGTACLSLCSDVLGCDCELEGREALVENAIIEPIELVFNRLCVEHTRGFPDNVSWPRHDNELRCVTKATVLEYLSGGATPWEIESEIARQL